MFLSSWTNQEGHLDLENKELTLLDVDETHHEILTFFQQIRNPYFVTCLDYQKPLRLEKPNWADPTEMLTPCSILKYQHYELASLDVQVSSNSYPLHVGSLLSKIDWLVFRICERIVSRLHQETKLVHACITSQSTFVSLCQTFCTPICVLFPEAYRAVCRKRSRHLLLICFYRKFRIIVAVIAQGKRIHRCSGTLCWDLLVADVHFAKLCWTFLKI